MSINGHTPFKHDRSGNPLSPGQKTYNEYLAELRVIVENVIGRLKRWHIMGGVYRNYIPKNGGKIPLSLVIKVIAALTNMDR